MKKISLVTMVCVILIATIVFTACAPKQEIKQETKQEITTPIKIGVMLPLTGDYASYGEDVRRAIELALKDSSNEGKYITIYDNKVKLTSIYK